MWPRDVGITLEDSGTSFRFLHAEIHINSTADASAVSVVPFNANSGFANGSSLLPDTSRLQLFLGTSFHTSEGIRAFMVSKICSCDQMCSGTGDWGCDPLAEICSEAAALGWPIRAIAAVAAAFPSRFPSMFSRTVRLFGRMLRKRAGEPLPDESSKYEFMLGLAREAARAVSGRPIPDR